MRTSLFMWFGVVMAAPMGLCAAGADAEAEADAIVQQALRSRRPGATISEQRLNRLIQDLSKNEPYDRINAVIELLKVAEHAKPALPMLRAAHARELGMAPEPKIAALMAKAIEVIEAGGTLPEPEPPTDDVTVAERLSDLLQKLDDPSEAVKRQAIAALRSMRAMAQPALHKLKALARREKDPQTDRAAQAAAERIEADLWFWPVERREAPTADLKPETLRARLAEVVAGLSDQLADKAVATKMKAMRQLAAMKAAAADAVPKLQDMASDEPSTLVRKAAGAAVRIIHGAQAASEKYREWKARQAEGEK